MTSDQGDAKNEDVLARLAVDRAAVTRALLDLEAAQERVRANAESVYEGKRRDLVIELLPVLDDLDRALAAAAEDSAPVTVASLVDGMRMVRNELEDVLTRYGVKRVDVIGQRFDPAAHEAVAAVPGDASSVGVVLGQVAAGYRISDTILRAAKVTVGVLSEPPTSGSRRPR